MTTERNSPAQTGNDIYERVTTQIIAAIEAGAGEYRMPWHHNGSAITTPVNVASRKAYRGVNVIALWAAAHAAGYAPIMPPDPQSQRLRRSPPRTLADARSGDCAGTPGARWEPYRSR